MDQQTVFLVVDDFDPMRKVTVNQLRATGFNQIFTAANGAEALRILRSQKVDIVLSDWNMPVMSGLDLFKAIRSDPLLAETPFILITAEAERRQINEAIAAGVTELIIKPYSPLRLTTQIQKALSPAHRQRIRAKLAQVERAAQSAPGAVGVAVNPALSDEEAATARRSALEEPPLLLLVDDAPDNLMLLSQLFKGEYRIRLAQNGAKALTLCQGDAPPDLVLLDVMMPGMDGFEVLQRLREHPTSENIPVIFVTAKAEEADRAKGLELGAVDYVTKPIDPPTLQLRVRNFMRFVNLRRELQAGFDDMVELARLREQVEHITRHDVKGPIAAALGILQGVVSEGCEHADDLQLAMQALHGALGTVSMSADLFRIESGTYQLKPEPLAILDLIQEVIATHRPLWADRQLNNRVQAADARPPQATAPWVMGEAALCRVVLQNLLKNAWEASPAHGEVLLSWQQLPEQWTLRITNAGVIPAAIRDRFFDKFVTAGKSQGTGLGTYSAQLLTRVQHGTLEFEVDDARQMTTLVWSLPLGIGC